MVQRQLRRSGVAKSAFSQCKINGGRATSEARTSRDPTELAQLVHK
jgi:hypothetical protein